MAGYDHSSDEGFSLSDCYCLVYKSILMLGDTTAPQKMSRRITFITVLTGSMMLYYLWEAMLISYFSTPKIDLPFNSLEELLTKSDRKVGYKVKNEHKINEIRFLKEYVHINKL